MAIVEGLRSVYDLVGGIAHFGRMLDKIRLDAAGRLPEIYQPYLGGGDPTYFDGRVCRFLGVSYPEVVEFAQGGGSDEAILAGCLQAGRQPSAEEIEIFTAFLTKRGWRDPATAGLRAEAAAGGYSPDQVATFPDLQDLEEGRAARFGPDPAPYRGPVQPTVRIEGLRSPYERLGGIVHFGRMLDKIRLDARGLLPPAWLESKGRATAFDGYCCRFLGIEYSALAERTLAGAADDDLLAWTFSQGREPTEEQMLIWNSYMIKRCWRDAYGERVQIRLREAGMPENAALTMFDFIDLDEGRPLRTDGCFLHW